MKKLIISTVTFLAFSSAFASCLETAKKDSESQAFLFLQDSIENIIVTSKGNETYEVYAQTEVDPEYTVVYGTYQVQYNSKCSQISYKVIQPMTEAFDYPDTDYSNDYGSGDECDHCGN